MNVDINVKQHNLYIQEEPEIAYINRYAKGLLIVEDSPLIVNSMIELLEDVEGIASIESCGTYSEAVNLLSTSYPAIVLLDINLPDKNGIVLLKYIKTFYPEITAVMVTNQNENFYKNICLEIGARYFLDKSNDFETLPAIVTTIIQL
jgi:DNA-binding NarL/FixJ family response regulator